jgi:uncharacterized protein YjdB
MKKIVFSLLLTILMVFPIGVFASGGISVSPSSLSMEVGQSKTFTITATNTIGDVTISSSNSGVASVSAGSWGTGMVDSGQTKSYNVTVTGVSEGTATITVLIDDASTFDAEDLSGQTRTVSVTVTKKPENNPVPTTPVVKPDTNNNNNTNNNNSNSNDTNTETKKEEKKSDNSKLKKLSIENYELTKVNDNKYTLTVDNKITMVTVKAEAEDAKAKVTGTGLHELKVGDNELEVVITAEDGSLNKIRIVVTRSEEEEITTKPVVDTSNDDTDSEEKSINIIAIIMIALNVILAISVIVLYGKNKKLKESIKKIG